MSWSFVKWGVPVLLIIAVAGSFATRKSFHAEITIPAPPGAVWGVLIDTKAYPQWNPVFVNVDGVYAKGEKVLNRVRDPTGAFLEMTAVVETLRVNAELRQVGGIPGILTFDHRWVLEPTEDGTRVIQHEVDRGIGPVVLETQTGSNLLMRRQNEALAERVRLVTTKPDR